MQESARGVLLTPAGLVLLMRVAGSEGPVWITPGGRIRAGEAAPAAAIREIREETGWSAPTIQAELWVRHGDYLAAGRRRSERERFFLMPTEMFEPSPAGMGAAERRRHEAYRWWAIDEIARSRESFIPRSLAELLATLRRSGPPRVPLVLNEAARSRGARSARRRRT